MNSSAGIGAFRKWVKLYRRGNGIGDCFAEIKFDGRELSISGVEGPKNDGNCRGSCGQIILDGATIPEDVLPGTVAPYAERLLAVWDRWHLNAMRAGCEHQRAADWKPCPGHYARPEEWKRVEFDATVYKRIGQRRTFTNCAGEPETVTIWEQSFPPGKYSAHSDRCSQDKVSKPCPVCGYKYGTAWLFEPVPVDVLEFLAGLEDRSEAVPQPWRH